MAGPRRRARRSLNGGIASVTQEERPCPACSTRTYEIGKEFRHAYRRTVTEMDKVLFTSITMNPAPIHLDEEYAETTIRRASG